VKHNLCAILVGGRSFGVATVDDVSGEKTDFGSHLDGFTTERLNSGVMLPQERLSEGNNGVGSSVCNTSDSSLLSVSSVKVS
jgi:hypothetical protein